jgi:hypothetical protein
MKNFESKIHIKNHTKQSDKVIAQDLEKKLDARIKQAQEKSMSAEEALGEGAVERLERIKDIIKKKFKERGIDEVEFLPIFFLKEKVSDSSNFFGVAGPDYIEMLDTDIEDPLLKQLSSLQVVSHELYHAMGRHSFKATSTENGDLQFNTEGNGASFVGETKHLHLFEEGSAVQFEHDICEEIKNLFPKETVEKYNNNIEQASLNRNTQNLRKRVGIFADVITPKISNTDDSLILAHQKGEIWRFKEVPMYNRAKLVVEYMASKIPNFYTMLEKARVKGQIIDIAKAIENTFGEGWYRRIATASTSEASSILEELKQAAGDNNS